MTARERWENWHWTTRMGVGIGLITSLWLLLTALFIPRTEYREDQHKQALVAQRDSVFQQRVLRFIDYQNCKEFCASQPRSDICGCLRPDRP